MRRALAGAVVTVSHSDVSLCFNEADSTVHFSGIIHLSGNECSFALDSVDVNLI